MNKEEFQENYLFEKYKNSVFRNGEDFRNTLKNESNINLDNLYRRIIIYQVKTFGYSLSNKDMGRNVDRQRLIKSRNKYMNDKIMKVWFK